MTASSSLPSLLPLSFATTTTTIPNHPDFLSSVPLNDSISFMTPTNPLSYNPAAVENPDIFDANASFSANPFCPTSIPDSSYLLQFVNAPYLISEIVVAILAIIGNSLTILVFVKNRKLRRLTNYYIVSLAAADLLVGVLGIPFAILTSLGMPEAREPCLLMLCTLILLCTISIFSLVGVSVDRYWAILHPLIYARLMTASRARREYHCDYVVTYNSGTIRRTMHIF